jgi:hypothetical protein
MAASASKQIDANTICSSGARHEMCSSKLVLALDKREGEH